MSEPTLICPHCHTEIHLTESLAAPLLAQKNADFAEKLQQKDAEMARQMAEIAKKEALILEQKNTLEAQVSKEVSAKLSAERANLIKEETKKAREASALEIEQKDRALNDLQTRLKTQDEKLIDAQNAQAEFLKKERALEDARREMDLTIQNSIKNELETVRQNAKREAEESLKLKVLEKDQAILSMQQKIEELKQKAEQGSQQLQGEAQEIALENLLTQKFPFDVIEPVAKGEFGGDVIQRVKTPSGAVCGSILWESKRTKNFSESWLTKLREDKRRANADTAVLISQTLPKDIAQFDLMDGVWVADPRNTLPMATILRSALIDIASARQAVLGQETKTELVYQYLTGQRFRQRVEAIVEAFSTMQEDLDKEKKAITKQWAKRGEQIERVMHATVGMYGDLQGIAGKSLPEIAALEFPALDAL